MKSILIILLFCCGLFIVAGCTSGTESQPETTPPTFSTTPPTTIYPPPVNITVVELTRFYRVQGGCDYGIRLEVTNNGQNAVTNIAVRLSLRDVKTGVVRDIENLPLERIAPGERKVFTRDFEGDCTSDYGIRAEIS
ncbi:MAG: hypothetical protein LUQ40_04685 [Methanomicrobiales archaeon]|nr:hypothetical protein [Methanomicrobiales archaeon]